MHTRIYVVTTHLDFLSTVVIVASTTLLSLVTIEECQITPKGTGRAQRLPANTVAELTSKPLTLRTHGNAG